MGQNQPTREGGRIAVITLWCKQFQFPLCGSISEALSPVQIEAVTLKEEIGLGTDEREGKHLSTRLHGLGKDVENNGSWGFDSLREHH